MLALEEHLYDPDEQESDLVSDFLKEDVDEEEGARTSSKHEDDPLECMGYLEVFTRESGSTADGFYPLSFTNQLSDSIFRTCLATLKDAASLAPEKGDVMSRGPAAGDESIDEYLMVRRVSFCICT
jgi:hypothetical protein